jgi:hypothetical protein
MMIQNSSKRPALLREGERIGELAGEWRCIYIFWEVKSRDMRELCLRQVKLWETSARTRLLYPVIATQLQL